MGIYFICFGAVVGSSGLMSFVSTAGFPKLVFPMIVDFCSGGYWIGAVGPYKYGAATTALLRGGGLTGDADETKNLTERMEELLQTFGSHLNPNAMGRPVSAELFLWPEKAGARAVFEKKIQEEDT